jgi:hypothetical protein
LNPAVVNFLPCEPKTFHEVVKVTPARDSQVAGPGAGEVCRNAIYRADLLHPEPATQDKTTLAASDRLLRLRILRQPHSRFPVERIEKAIYPVFVLSNEGQNDPRNLPQLLARYGGQVPSDLDELLSLPGVGRKTANIVVTLGFRKTGIAVDTHVHRISNRLGYVRTKTPEKTEMALRRKLPSEVLDCLQRSAGRLWAKPYASRPPALLAVQDRDVL